MALSVLSRLLQVQKPPGGIIGAPCATLAARFKSTSAKQTSPAPEPHQSASDKPDAHSRPANEQKYESVAEQDRKLREKMEGLSGDGGEAGLELEGGQPVAMKRSIKNNMFRLI